MITVVAAVIERADRRILIGQRRRVDSSPLKWEFPGGKVGPGESPEAALSRELREELGVSLRRSREVARVKHTYPGQGEEFEIRFFAAEIGDEEMVPKAFEKLVWAVPKDFRDYDFLEANEMLVAHLATGRIKPREILEAEKPVL